MRALMLRLTALLLVAPLVTAPVHAGTPFRVFGRGGATLTAQIISATGATEQEGTSGLKGAAATVDADGYTTITLGGESAGASCAPPAALTYTVELEGIDGAALDPLDIADVGRVIGWTTSTPATDLSIIWGVSAGGPPSDTRLGIASRLFYSGGSWRASRAVNVNGSSWSVWVDAAATDALTIGGLLFWEPGTGGANMRSGTAALKADGVLSATTNANVEGTNGSGGAQWTHGFIGACWTAGDGSGTAGTVTVSARAISIDLFGVPDAL